MGAKLKCLYCEGVIDKVADFGQYDKVTSNRYAHNECIKNQDKKEFVINKIHNKMRAILKNKYNKNKINQQIQELLDEGKSEVGILKTLEYWYDHKGNSSESAKGGIGIVSYVYGEALDYYDTLEKATKQNINVTAMLSPRVEKYTIKHQYFKKPIGLKLFELR